MSSNNTSTNKKIGDSMRQRYAHIYADLFMRKIGHLVRESEL
jgi:hypothetical protein